jgi:hypothetical protein
MTVRAGHPHSSVSDQQDLPAGPTVWVVTAPDPWSILRPPLAEAVGSVHGLSVMSGDGLSCHAGRIARGGLSPPEATASGLSARWGEGSP